MTNKPRHRGNVGWIGWGIGIATMWIVSGYLTSLAFTSGHYEMVGIMLGPTIVTWFTA